jgi:two-component system sensor histidine kinase/response regulator
MKPKKILVVDNDPSILALVSATLQMDGHIVQAMSNARQALQSMTAHPPDLIISDVNMPEMDGYQFYAAVRENSAWLQIPFIFLSANAGTRFLHQGYATGADLYLLKPVRSEDLRIAVNARLKRGDELSHAAEEKIEETKKQLLRIFSHELRTPLSFVKGYLGFLEEGVPPSRDILDPMRAGMDRLENLINDLILVFNLESESPRRMLQKYGQPVPLKSPLYDAILRVQPLAVDKEITFFKRISEEHQVWGLYDYLQDIFYRVLDNAVKFSAVGKSVVVSKRVQDGEAAIYIQDEGIGISSQNHTSIFKKFNQIDRQRMEQQGVGLGLAITERLVALHNGRITLTKNDAGGTTVKISFPLWQP